MGFAERLKYLIDSQYNGKTTSFAGAIGVSESNVRSYLKGVSPKVDVVANIAKICDVSCAWLLLGEGESNAKVEAYHSQVAIGKNINQQKDVVESSTADVEMLKAKIASLERELQQKDETIRAKDETLQLYKQLLGKN